MKQQSVSFIGLTEEQLPFSITSRDYEKVENRLKRDIIGLIKSGITRFYTRGKTGMDTTCAQLVIYLRDEMKYDIELYLIVSDKSTIGYNLRQLDDYEWIKNKADGIVGILKGRVP